MQRLRTVTSLDVSTVAGHHAMPAALLLNANNVTTKIFCVDLQLDDDRNYFSLVITGFFLL